MSARMVDVEDPFRSIQFCREASTFVVTTENALYEFDIESKNLINHQKFNQDVDLCGVIDIDLDDTHKEDSTRKDSFFYVKSSNIFMNKKTQLTFGAMIKDVKFLPQFIIVVLDAELRVYNLEKLQKIATFPIKENHSFAAVVNNGTLILAFSPADAVGSVSIVRMVIQEPDYEKPIVGELNITPHQSSIRLLELNTDGSLLATCSGRGTVIRVYNTITGELVKELRRGTRGVDMYSIAFSPDSQYLASYSSSGTVHFFSLASGDRDRNTYSSLNPLNYIGLNYLSSERSKADYSAPGGAGKCAFYPKSSNIVNLVTASGTLYTITFDTERYVESLSIHELIRVHLPKFERAESDKIKKQYPDSLPVLIEKHEKSDLPLLNKRLYVITKSLMMSDIQKRISEKLGNIEGIVFFVNDKQLTVLEMGSPLENIYEKYKEEDGFLHIQYS